MNPLQNSNQTRQESESDLLQRLQQGDAEAVKEWFEAYHDRLLGLVQSKVSNPKDAEEVTQEIFLNCLKHLNLFRGEAAIWTWMSSIARHEIADYYRKKYAKKAIQTLPLVERLLPETRQLKSSEEISQQVVAVLERMTSEYRELLLLKYVDELRVKKIAAELGRSVKAVESDLFRARNEFRALWAMEIK